MIVVVDTEYKRGVDDYDVDAVSVFLVGDELVTDFFSVFYEEGVDSVIRLDDGVVFIFRSGRADPVVKLHRFLSVVFDVYSFSVTVLVHNLDTDDVYIRVRDLLREYNNFIEVKLSDPISIHFVMSVHNGKVVRVVDTASLDFTPLGKDISAVDSKRNGLYVEYMVSDVVNTYKFFVDNYELFMNPIRQFEKVFLGEVV